MRIGHWVLIAIIVVAAWYAWKQGWFSKVADTVTGG